HGGAVAPEQLDDVTDAADVGVAVFAREPEALGEVLAHFVAVEDFDGDAATTQLCAHRGRERGLARAGQPGEPQREPVRLRDTLVRYQFRLSHRSLSRPSPGYPPSPHRGEGDRGVRQKRNAPASLGKRARSASRAPVTS